MNFIKHLRSQVSTSSILMAHLPLASAGLFLDIAHAHPSEAHPSETSVVETNSIESSFDIVNDETDTVLANRFSSTLKENTVSTRSSFHALLEPLAALSENFSKFPLIQPHRSEDESPSQHPFTSLLPLSANSLPVDAVADPSRTEESAKEINASTSSWQSSSNHALKQWRQPSIQVLSVDVKDIGQSLQVTRPLKGLQKVFANVSQEKTTNSSTPGWNAFCFADVPTKSMSDNIEQIHQLIINGHTVAEFATTAEANLMVKRLRSWMQEKMYSPSTLVAKVQDGKVVGQSQNHTFFEVSEAISQLLEQNRDTIAIAWINNLRTALDVKPLSLVDAQIQLYGLQRTSETMLGTASWYGPYFHGRQTASGEHFHQGELTVAHKSLPFDTYLKVTNLENDQSVVVRVNDRGPYIGERSLDLSRNAAQCLGSEQDGVIPYRAVIMEPSI
ncbi:MAG: septal ring lytic transglycosylase RlpA family protein [Cyanobacteria bacterium P01_F01_bin.150]